MMQDELSVENCDMSPPISAMTANAKGLADSWNGLDQSLLLLKRGHEFLNLLIDLVNLLCQKGNAAQVQPEKESIVIGYFAVQGLHKLIDFALEPASCRIGNLFFRDPFIPRRMRHKMLQHLVGPFANII